MNEREIYNHLNSIIGPKVKLVGYSIGFIAGAYSLLMGRPIVDNLFKILLLFVVWYPLLILCTFSNAWGMFDQVKALQRSEETGDKNE